MGNSAVAAPASGTPPEWAAPEATKASEFKAGDKVQYYSETHSNWVDCFVVGTRPTGCVQVDCKPGYWIPLRDQATKLRLAGTGTVGAFSTILPFSTFGSAYDAAKLGSSEPTSSIIAEAGTLGSWRSLGSLILPTKGRSVGFDPGVAVVAFKEDTPAGKLGRVGRTYERNLESAVDVPATWSFTSGASVVSSGGPAAQQDAQHQGEPAAKNSSWLTSFAATPLSSIPEGPKVPPGDEAAGAARAPPLVPIGPPVDEPSWLSRLVTNTGAEPGAPAPSGKTAGELVRVEVELPGERSCCAPAVTRQRPWFACCCTPDGTSHSKTAI